MKKWEEQNRLKNMKKGIKNAKPIVSSNIKQLKSPTANRALNIQTSHSSSSKNSDASTGSSKSINPKLNDFYDMEKNDPTQIPLYRLLKLFNL